MSSQDRALPGARADARAAPASASPGVSERSESTGAVDVPEEFGPLLVAAREIAVRAYTPYSRYQVGAAALTEDGRLIAGCNVENAALGGTLCAECGLISELFATGGGKLSRFVCVGGPEGIDPADRPVCMPCGRCRQLLSEHAADDLIILTTAGPASMAEGSRSPSGRRTSPQPPSPTPPPEEDSMTASAPRTEPFDAVDVIRTKRGAERLSEEQIDWVVDAYTRGVVAEEQMAALAMAIFLNGMDRAEIARWTQAMIDSGERMDFASLSKPTTDKHSTGGVGDKITLPLAPLVACFGVAVPQLSGRGLGHTGGTLDKLEAIPGWRADLSNAEMMAQLEDVGAVICAAGSGLAPADKKLYALRDITGTVEAIPLIASSIMSKKIAEGTASLVLDVKTGAGAFMRDEADARELARTMVDLGTDAGVRTVALLTDMSAPLGLTVGNALEVRESVEVLSGGGPADVVELTVALAREMLAAAGKPDADVEAALADGRAMDTWKRMIAAQGGDPEAPLPVAAHTEELRAREDGVVTGLDAMQVGVAGWRLGAGRSRPGEAVQAGAGVELHKVIGDEVRAGDLLATLHTDTPERFARSLEAIDGAWEISREGKPGARKIVLDRIA